MTMDEIKITKIEIKIGKNTFNGQTRPRIL